MPAIHELVSNFWKGGREIDPNKISLIDAVMDGCAKTADNIIKNFNLKSNQSVYPFLHTALIEAVFRNTYHPKNAEPLFQEAEHRFKAEDQRDRQKLLKTLKTRDQKASQDVTIFQFKALEEAELIVDLYFQYCNSDKPEIDDSRSEIVGKQISQSFVNLSCAMEEIKSSAYNNVVLENLRNGPPQLFPHVSLPWFKKKG